MRRDLPDRVVTAILEKRRLRPDADTVEIAERVTAAIGWHKGPAS